MALFFRDEHFDQLKEALPREYRPEEAYVCGTFYAQDILRGVDFSKAHVDGDFFVICEKGTTTTVNFHEASYVDEDWVTKVIKKELEDHFHYEAEVKFWLDNTWEQEPDPLPPMYWGGTETVYCFALTAKLNLKKPITRTPLDPAPERVSVRLR